MKSTVLKSLFVWEPSSQTDQEPSPLCVLSSAPTLYLPGRRRSPFLFSSFPYMKHLNGSHSYKWISSPYGVKYNLQLTSAHHFLRRCTLKIYTLPISSFSGDCQVFLQSNACQNSAVLTFPFNAFHEIFASTNTNKCQRLISRRNKWVASLASTVCPMFWFWNIKKLLKDHRSQRFEEP